MAHLHWFLALLSACTYTLALDVAGFVQWNEHCSGIAELGHARVLLDNADAWGSITRDGRFVIPDVAPGTYLLSVVSHDHHFDQVMSPTHLHWTILIPAFFFKLRIDVPSEAELVPEVRPYVPGTPMNPASKVKMPHPIKLIPRLRNNYFVPKQSFNLVGMFQNPMMLMMVFAGAMMLGTPYLMKNMDPEMVEEFKHNQAKMANLQSSLQSGDLKSGISAIMGTDESQDAAAATTATPAKPSNSQARKAKKRR
ncbi:hypothetical protein EVG20_g4902 [Dentipellis fragilis]|uniref:ER membrane protein complex subunit 7 beta-sandwich domain-containing protein n=1 Tax=Dentipellis fragilis TaxID=205917 RepID=A0A4Y9YX92_9AGAM|nr:hypothetical protein EVG20_g4902 [Dentipellis fragilis]